MYKSPEDLDDEELVNQYRSLYQRIEENTGGYGTTDLRRYEEIKSEVESRGIIIEKSLEFRDGTSGEVIAE